jgi:Raf kinase inhibitor-like YbhB/YbcL family protein
MWRGCVDVFNKLAVNARPDWLYSLLMLKMALIVGLAAPNAAQAQTASTTRSSFALTSADLRPNARIAEAFVFNSMGCKGENRSPALAWSNPPPGTKSFAITMYDPDAPTGSGWWHWVMFDIPAGIAALPPNAGDLSQNLAPVAAIQSRTDFGSAGYGGPCPPLGDKPHRYIFTIHALAVETLGLDKEASGAMVGFFLNTHRLGRASLTVTYSR